MCTMPFLLVAFLLSADTLKAETLFVLVGQTLPLVIQEDVPLEQGDDFIWKFNHKLNLIKIRSGGGVVLQKEKVTRGTERYSIGLMNVQKSNSGIYTAVVSGDNDRTVVTYHVEVREPVTRPVLRALPSPCSATSCNITVICSTETAQINATASCQGAWEAGELNSLGAHDHSLQMSLLNSTISCNHSNPVSSIKEEKELEVLCRQAHQDEKFLILLVLILFLLLLVLLPVFIFKRHLWVWRRVKFIKDKTDPSKEPNNVPRRLEPDGAPCEIVYSVIQMDQESVAVPMNKTPVDTIYSLVTRTNKSDAACDEI